ncbi:hypothetical protein B0H16DRAFT_1460160 [Mycena metata]|uniref:Uncharacterized protein n=1 Tax=Mycena metata TaxID=1033252 RepID=A0AAD7IVU1_9AGAR|nr:hypothetical protein B0H16DRAFT_1460160 [Mycena metata]
MATSTAFRMINLLRRVSALVHLTPVPFAPAPWRFLLVFVGLFLRGAFKNNMNQYRIVVSNDYAGILASHTDIRLLNARSHHEAQQTATEISCRTLFDIIWGCLATIVACTWVALHQNVPDLELGHFALLMRKLRMMLVTIIAPEVVVEFNVSKTRGFFCAMGGFVSEEGHTVSKRTQLPAYISAIRAIKKADIEDKSKGDTLSKGVAIVQGLWFMTQCLAHVSQHLPLTELEVATLAFAVLSVVIRLLWLHKPLDVQQPIIVAGSEVEIDPLHEEDITPMKNDQGLLQRIEHLIFGHYPEYSPLSSTSVPSFYSIEFVVGLVVYIFCRLFLIILSFTTLRALPPSAFVDVNWSNYIPHL